MSFFVLFLLKDLIYLFVLFFNLIESLKVIADFTNIHSSLVCNFWLFCLDEVSGQDSIVSVRITHHYRYYPAVQRTLIVAAFSTFPIFFHSFRFYFAAQISAILFRHFFQLFINFLRCFRRIFRLFQSISVYFRFFRLKFEISLRFMEKFPRFSASFS